MIHTTIMTKQIRSDDKLTKNDSLDPKTALEDDLSITPINIRYFLQFDHGSVGRKIKEVSLCIHRITTRFRVD